MDALDGHGRARRRRRGEHYRVVAALPPQLREWAANNLVVVDGEADAGAVGGRAEGHPPGQTRAAGVGASCSSTGATMRAVCGLDRDAFQQARRRGAPPRGRRLTGASSQRMAEKIEKAAFTRADLVELIGAQLPIDTERSPARGGRGRRRRDRHAAHAPRGRRTSARVTSGSPWTASWPKKPSCWTWSMPATRARSWCGSQAGHRWAVRGPETRRRYHRAPRRSWCARCQRAGRGRQDHLDARAARRRAPLPTGASWWWRRPARPSTWRCARAPATPATPSPRPCNRYVTTPCSSTVGPWSWSTKRAWSAPTISANC